MASSGSSISSGRSLPPSSGRPSVVSVRSLLSTDGYRQQLAGFDALSGTAVSFHGEMLPGKEEAEAAAGVNRSQRAHGYSSEWVTEWSNQGWRKSTDARKEQSEGLENSKRFGPAAAPLWKDGSKRGTLNLGASLQDEEQLMLDTVLQNGRSQERQGKNSVEEPLEDFSRAKTTGDLLPASLLNGIGINTDEAAGESESERSSEAGGSPSVFWRQRGHSDVNAGGSGEVGLKASAGSVREGGADTRSVAELIKRFREGPPSRRGDRMFPFTTASDKSEFHDGDEDRRRGIPPSAMTEEESLWESLFHSEDESGPRGAHPPLLRGFQAKAFPGEADSIETRPNLLGAGSHAVNGGGRLHSFAKGESKFDLGGTKAMRERTQTVNGNVSITVAPVRRLWPSEEKTHGAFSANRGVSGMQMDGQVSSEGESSPTASSSPLQFDEEDILEKWRRWRSAEAKAAANGDGEGESKAASTLLINKNAHEEPDWESSMDESEVLEKVRQRLGMVAVSSSPPTNPSSPRSCSKSPQQSNSPRHTPPQTHPQPWRDTIFDPSSFAWSDKTAFSPEKPYSSPPTGRSPLGRSPPPEPHDSSLASRRGIHPIHLKLAQDEAATVDRSTQQQSFARLNRPFGTYSPPRPKVRPLVCHAKTFMDDSRSSPSPSSSPSVLSSFPSPPDSPILSPPPIVTLPRHLARAAPVTIETPFPPGLPHLTCRVSGLGGTGLGSPPMKAVGSPTRSRRRGGGGEGAWDFDLRRALLSLGGDSKHDPTAKAPRKTSPAVSAMISETVDDWLLGGEFPTCSWGMDAPDAETDEPAAAFTEALEDLGHTTESSPSTDGAGGSTSVHPEQSPELMQATVDLKEMQENKDWLQERFSSRGATSASLFGERDSTVDASSGSDAKGAGFALPAAAPAGIECHVQDAGVHGSDNCSVHQSNIWSKSEGRNFNCGMEKGQSWADSGLEGKTCGECRNGGAGEAEGRNGEACRGNGFAKEAEGSELVSGIVSAAKEPRTEVIRKNGVDGGTLRNGMSSPQTGAEGA